MPGGGSPTSLAEIQRPADKLALLDAGTIEMWDYATDSCGGAAHDHQPTGAECVLTAARQRGGVALRHSETFNMLFLDGHVKARKNTAHSEWDARGP
jgi:prepilin-type processing-associated H-X9-DG protein